jgi:microcin C transport system ATP-binding protein
MHAARLKDAESLLPRYPGELSTGMAQRVMIALALLHRPASGAKLLLADEATSALDVINAAGILDLFRTLHGEQGVSILFITHDLAAAASVSHRITVLHEGRIVEEGAPEDVLLSPQHAYTRALTQALSPARATAQKLTPDPHGACAG